jgi:hypothetical protein
VRFFYGAQTILTPDTIWPDFALQYMGGSVSRKGTATASQHDGQQSVGVSLTKNKAIGHSANTFGLSDTATLYTSEIFDILQIAVQLSTKSKATEYLEALLRYLVASVDSTKTEELKKMVQRTIKTGGNSMPTIAEKWYQDGIEKGIEKGIEEGKIEDAHRMIDKGMTNADIRDITVSRPVSVITMSNGIYHSFTDGFFGVFIYTDSSDSLNNRRMSCIFLDKLTELPHEHTV